MIQLDQLVVGFGGNVGGEDAVLERFVRAREALGALGPVTSARLYRTAPIGPEQSDFLNTAIRVRVADATPDEILSLVREIELQLGRDRRVEERWGPRKIDLDILVWGTRVIRTPDLEIPHPRIAERRFVLLPLIDLVGPDARLLGSPLTLEEYEARASTQAVDEIAASW
jgi:2-amino-4-hydroxy-6-hydroxymethyldihydropteridine diphosphokinase